MAKKKQVKLLTSLLETHFVAFLFVKIDFISLTSFLFVLSLQTDIFLNTDENWTKLVPMRFFKEFNLPFPFRKFKIMKFDHI